MTEESLDQFRERMRETCRSSYFDRQGNPMDNMEWVRKCEEDMDYRIVKQDRIGKYFVSTIWLGINMQFMQELPPLIFETMIFVEGESEDGKKDELNGCQDRYTTEEQAIQGHEDAVQKVNDLIKTEEYGI